MPRASLPTPFFLVTTVCPFLPLLATLNVPDLLNGMGMTLAMTFLPDIPVGLSAGRAVPSPSLNVLKVYAGPVASQRRALA